MRVCVTGASGLIGRSVVRWLIQEPDITVSAVMRTLAASDVHENPTTERISWIRADLGSYQDCERIVDQHEVIIHLAHTNSPLTSDQDISSDTQLNLVPTLNLLSAVQRSGRCLHVIYPSSGGGIYGANTTGKPFREQDPCLPGSSYGIQKLAAEHYLRVYAERGYLTATVLRISNAYGWIHSPDRKQGLIGAALYQIRHNHPVRIIGSSANVRDYVHILDIYQAIRRSLHRKSGFEVFNIGTGSGTSVDQVIHTIEKVIGSSVARTIDRNINARFLSNWCVLDISQARELLGWEPRIGIEEGIRTILQESQ